MLVKVKGKAIKLNGRWCYKGETEEITLEQYEGKEKYLEIVKADKEVKELPQVPGEDIVEEQSQEETEVDEEEIEKVEEEKLAFADARLQILQDGDALAHRKGAHGDEVLARHARGREIAQAVHGEYEVLGVLALVHVLVALQLKIEEFFLHRPQRFQIQSGKKAQQLAFVEAAAQVLRVDVVDAQV